MGPAFLMMRACASITGWRWRESNPRPTVWNQGFSGCSQLMFYLAPAMSLTTRWQAQLP